jgi:D-sedoheptulose 7-phosphate isomerase
MKKDLFFLRKYHQNFQKILNKSFNENLNKLIQIKSLILQCNKSGGKLIVIGNGGSASIASHFSVDITKNAGIKCINFNEPNLITCFSNDFGYEKWVEKSINFYADKNDIIILISCSGRSKNLINALKISRKMKIKTVTFTGNSATNPLRKKGNINIWVQSKAYNYIENIHQIFLLSIVDLLIGKTIYKA